MLNKEQELDKSKQELAVLSSENARKCYQCGKCTAGCVMAEYMDVVPNRIMRLVQLGLVDEAIKSKSIWLCASCSTCSVRCPKGIDVAHEMESLRMLAKSKGVLSEKKMDTFHNVFLWTVKNTGRVYEVGLILGRNLGTGKVLRDVPYGIPYITRGKIKIIPEMIKGRNEVKDIFEKADMVYKRELAKAKEE